MFMAVAGVGAIGGYGVDRMLVQPVVCVVSQEDPFARLQAQRQADIDAVRNANPDRLR